MFPCARASSVARLHACIPLYTVNISRYARRPACAQTHTYHTRQTAPFQPACQPACPSISLVTLAQPVVTFVVCLCFCLIHRPPSASLNATSRHTLAVIVCSAVPRWACR